MASSIEWVMSKAVRRESDDDPLQLSLHDLAGHGVDGRERLIEQEHLGIGDESPGEAGTLAHASGELTRIGALEPDQAHEPDDVSDPLVGAIAETPPLDAEVDVVPDRPPREERIVLEDDRTFGAGPGVTTSPTSTRPSVGRTRPAMQLSSVVFPQPDGPTTVTNSPGAMSRLTRQSAMSRRSERACG